MTTPKPDAVVTMAHREEVARAWCVDATGDSMAVRWCADWLDAHERGVELKLGRVVTGKLDATAQALANLEAAVRAEYAGVVRCARDVTDARPGRMAPIQALVIELNRLEILKNG